MIEYAGRGTKNKFAYSPVDTRNKRKPDAKSGSANPFPDLVQDLEDSIAELAGSLGNEIAEVCTAISMSVRNERKHIRTVLFDAPAESGFNSVAAQYKGVPSPVEGVGAGNLAVDKDDSVSGLLFFAMHFMRVIEEDPADTRSNINAQLNWNLCDQQLHSQLSSPPFTPVQLQSNALETENLLLSLSLSPDKALQFDRPQHSTQEINMQ